LSKTVWEIVGRTLPCPVHIFIEDNTLFICSYRVLADVAATINGKHVKFKMSANRMYPYIAIGENTPELLDMVKGTQVPLPTSCMDAGTHYVETLTIAARKPERRSLWRQYRESELIVH